MYPKDEIQLKMHKCGPKNNDRKLIRKKETPNTKSFGNCKKNAIFMVVFDFESQLHFTSWI